MTTLTSLPVSVSSVDTPNVEQLSALSDREVADQLTTWAGRVAAGEARLLLYLGEFDRRQAWAEPGMLSCAHWMSWRLGMGLQAACERVRVANALRELPATAAAFAAGRVSWTQVRAITRVAVAEDERTYLDLARHASGSQLERLTRGVRRARRAIEDARDPDAAAWRMRTRISYDEDGTMVITTRLPAEHGAVVLAALEQARVDLDQERQAASAASHSVSAPAESNAEAAAGCGQLSAAAESATATVGCSAGDEPVDLPDDTARCGQLSAAAESATDSPDAAPAASLADALLRLAHDYLDRRGQDRPETARRYRSRLVAYIDPLSGWARLPDGELLPPGAAARIVTGCDLGRTSREPDLALRELLGALDGERCRFPGCTRRRKLHAHHVRHWSAGGATDLANLCLLCSRHHALVHADGFELALHPDRTLRVSTAAGVPIPHRADWPRRSAHDLDPDRFIGADTLPPIGTDARINLDYAVWVLLQQAA